MENQIDMKEPIVRGRLLLKPYLHDKNARSLRTVL